MAIIPLDSGNLDTFEIVGRPLQKFVSGSHHGPTGSVSLVNNKSKSVKDVEPRSEFGSGPVIDNSYRSIIESAKLNDYAQFTITFASGTLSQRDGYPSTVRLVTRVAEKVGIATKKDHKFRLIASASQTHGGGGFNTEIDVTDIVAMQPADFTSKKGLLLLAKKVQRAINQPLDTPDPSRPGLTIKMRHFVANEPEPAGSNYEMRVQYIKTPYYDGGVHGFVANNSIANAPNISVSSLVQASGSNLTTKLESLLEKTREQPVTANQGKTLRVNRFEPSVKFTKDTMRKNVVKDVLYPSYRHLYPNLHWAYTNYHCLNFFTGSGIPDDSAILYLNKLEPKYSVEIPVLKNNTFNSDEFTKNTDSGFVSPQAGFSVDGVTNSDKVFVMDSTQEAGASYGRNITLTRQIQSGTMTTVRFKAIKAVGAALPSVGSIGLKTTIPLVNLHRVKITLIDNEGSPRTRHYVFDAYNNYAVQADEVAVNISAATSVQEALTALRTKIHSNDGHGRSGDPKIIVSTPGASSMVLTQKTAGASGDTTITVTRDPGKNTIISSFAGGAANDQVQTAGASALDAPEPAVAAAGQITISSATVNGALVTLISSDSTSKVYKFDASQATSGQINGSGQVVVGCSGSPDQNAIASRFQEAILSSKGHNGKIKVSVNSNVLSLTQRQKGASGNRTISKSGSNTGSITVDSNFTNGFTGEDIVILHRPSSSDTWSEVYRLNSATQKTGNLNEWTRVEFDVTGQLIETPYYLKLAQSPPSGDGEDHHILNDISFTLEALPEGADKRLPYAYSPREDFTMSFWVKPRIVDKDKSGGYKAGTVLHLTSSYAISIVSGSSVDGLGRANKFRVLCQFDSSADVAPSNVPLVKDARLAALRSDWSQNDLFKNGDYPKDGRVITNSLMWENDADLIFASSDNSLDGDTWQHVTIRWSANKNNRTGSIFIDGNLDSSFHINSGSAMPSSMPDSRGDPSVLFVGNYFDGINDGEEGSLQSQFFNGNAAYQEGLPLAYKTVSNAIPNYQIDNFLYRDPNDSLYQVDHPLKAEVHEVRIFKSFKSQAVIKKEMTTRKMSGLKDLVFYLPVHFTPEAPVRDVMQTPFQTHRTETNDPFNVALSFGVGGKTMNLPNFLREHVQKNYPRLLNLTASAITSTDTQSRTADEWLGSIPSHRKGNYTVLPCDNGLFRPSYTSFMLVTGSKGILASTGSINYAYRDDNGYYRPGLISLRGMVSTASLPLNPGHLLQDPSPAITAGMTDSEIISAKSEREKHIFNQLEGATPEDPGIAPGNILSVLNRTRDPDSNEVVFFDISNMFYGNRLAPETISIKDPGLSGTYGSVSITLKDDGYGNIYRHDCLSPPAKWNNVGDVVYDEGIITLKNPVLSHFGRKYFEIEFRGEQKVPVLEVTVPCGRNVINSSSNPNYQPLKPLPDASEYAEDFVYITGVNLHDENFNIIGKATFAQPIIKRETDTFLVKMKMDF